MPHRAPGSRGCRFWPPWHSDAGDRAAYLCGRCAKPAPPALHRQTCTTCGFPPDLRLTSPPVARSSRRSREQCGVSCVCPHRAPAGFWPLRREPSSALPSVPLCIVNWYQTPERGAIFLGRSSQNFQSERCQFPLTPALARRLSGAIDCSGGARVFDLHQTIEKGRSASPGRPFAWMHRESATASIRLRHPEPSGRLTAPRQAGRSCPSGCFECSYHLMRSPPARDQSERSRRMDTPPATRAARRLDWFTRIAGTANNPSDD